MKKHRTVVEIASMVVLVVLIGLVGCSGNDPLTPDNSPAGHPATRAEVIGDWDLAVFWSSSQGAVTQQEYFDQPTVDEVTASFRADGTFSMVLRDEDGNMLSTVEGTWEMPQAGDLTIHWPDRSVDYAVRWVQGWIWTRSAEFGEEIRLYFR